MKKFKKNSQVLVYMGKHDEFDSEVWLAGTYLYELHGHYVKIDRYENDPFIFKTDEDKIKKIA